MAKQKKLLVRTPVTKDGKNLAYDDKKQPIYTESIVEIGAKRDFESLNAKLPSHLRHELSVIEENDVKDNASQKVINEKDAEIEALKKQIAAAEKATEDAKSKAAADQEKELAEKKAAEKATEEKAKADKK